MLPPRVNAASDSGTFKVGMEAGYAPFNWTQTTSANNAVKIQGSQEYANGYDVQIARKVAKALHKKVVVVKTSWDGLPPALTSGKIDAIIAGMSPTPDRRKTIDFSNPYYISNLTMVVRKDSKYAKAKSIADFKGAKITAQAQHISLSGDQSNQGCRQGTGYERFSSYACGLGIRNH